MGQLQCRPVQRTGRPCYPTKLQILDHPESLARHVPPAWLAKAEVAGALSAFLAVNAAGCADKAKSSQPHVDPRLANAAIVAPVFEHGAGYSSTGCSAVASPVFLPEEQALQIIQEELAKYGLNVAQRRSMLESVRIKGQHPVEQCNWITDQRWRATVEVEEPLELDLNDPQRNVGLEYVAHTDFVAFGGDEFLSQGIDIRGAAMGVAIQVRQRGKGLFFGAFYDPATYADDSRLFEKIKIAPTDGIEAYQAAMDRAFANAMQEAREAAENESKRLLREQVKDFVDWLKGQGVI